jgi:hypothetical protein
VPNECSRIASGPKHPIFAGLKSARKEKASAPVLTSATAAQIDKLDLASGKNATAKATVTKSDGSQFSCSYEMVWEAAKPPSKDGIQFVPKTENCVAMR